MESGFYNGTEVEEIGFAPLINSLSPPNDHGDQHGWEGWCCAWSPDGTHFAFSLGGHVVKIIPWTAIRDHQFKFSPDEIARVRRRHHSDSQYIKLSETVVNKVRKASIVGDVIINCGAPVQSLAFGCSTARTQPGSIQLNLRALRHVEDVILATGLKNGRLKIWDAYSGGVLWELLDHKDSITQLKFNPSGNLHLASVSNDGTCKLWDLQDDGNMYKTLRPLNKGYARACAFSPNGRFLAMAGTQKYAVILNIKTYEVVLKLTGHYHDVVDCDYSPDGALLATSSYDTTVIVWDASSGQKIRVFCHLFPTPHPTVAGGVNNFYVHSLSFSRDGEHIASACEDGHVRFWSLSQENLPVKVSIVQARFVQYSPDGSVLATVQRQGDAIFYRSPMSVAPLKNLCRMAVRITVPPEDIDGLSIPAKHKEYLRYLRDI